MDEITTLLTNDQGQVLTRDECRTLFNLFDNGHATGEEMVRAVEALTLQKARASTTHVAVPTTVDIAKMMVLLGTDYLQRHAPDVLNPSQQSAQPVGWVRTLNGKPDGVLYAEQPSLHNYHSDWSTSPVYAAAQPVEVPSDFHTHKNAWRNALEMAEQNALVNPPDLDDKSYWQHEIAAFDRAYSELGTQPVDTRADGTDAACYRWLRDKALGFDQIGSSTPYVVRGQSMDTLDGERLDTAVRTAMGLPVEGG